ncbi:paraquat-inducible protein A [Tropicimonas isoalkanivorans]|uniref:Paraquat-inducible protein A n=1 Tax=Tropicimonas isoalkanivorans TaxID=441112 RepID=A0A1I1P7G2_9RHOB|nr:paraquat-inducible protein A [Tropicimonas isoalkanivorans]SFD05749.1 paraquat-inducible protein A [Tropicimonas isoalkanivorans]
MITNAPHAIDPEELIACPSCDALYRVTVPENGERAVCARCHSVLIAPMEGAILRIVALALTILILLITSLFLPFLRIEANGLSNATSIFGAAMSFSQSHMVFLSFAVMSLIIFVPIARAMLLIYVLTPLILGRRPLPASRPAFRFTERLRPWSMAEVFVLGVGVALVKVADLARVQLGVAFWLFAVLVVVTILQDQSMCRWSIWHILDTRDADPDGVRPEPSGQPGSSSEAPAHG